mmetsp:Transcript_79113/g.219868  ORF Transcript_79113/g.219868 Transcript_79113/m.219868 type:complete len:110 (-) Transcript_79113:97-426(-)
MPSGVSWKRCGPRPQDERMRVEAWPDRRRFTRGESAIGRFVTKIAVRGPFRFLAGSMCLLQVTNGGMPPWDVFLIRIAVAIFLLVARAHCKRQVEAWRHRWSDVVKFSS